MEWYLKEIILGMDSLRLNKKNGSKIFRYEEISFKIS